MENLLLTQAKLIELYDFDTNLEPKQFEQYLLRIQRNSLKPLLGAQMYDDITSLAPSQDYSNLIDPYIDSFLSACFAAKYVVEGNLFHTNRGNFQFDQDTTQNPAAWQLKQISENYKQEQSNYRNEIIIYLDDNKSLYPLWNSDKGTQTTASFAII